ncbi:MAG: NADPH-dependent FMN reductase [Trueperella sp.]|nr:NADPH-dependent FMN reductase [Trueperella sp.]
MKIAYLVGSLAADSINRALSEALVELAPEGVELIEAPIKDLPLFNRDLESDFPPAAAKLKEILSEADGVIFVSPEHNRSYTPAMHNAVDWSSRPAGNWTLSGKPIATIGASQSSVATALGQKMLRSSLDFFNPKIMGQPEGYISAKASGLLDDRKVTDEGTRAFLQRWLDAFVEFVKENS